MKLNIAVVMSVVLSGSLLSAQAAQELRPAQAAALKPFKRIAVEGHFNAIADAVAAVSRRADQLGAEAFYIVGSNDSNNGGNQRVIADLYHRDAPAASAQQPRQRVDGVEVLPRREATTLEPFDTVTVSGFFPNQPALNKAIAKAARAKGAAAYYIVRQIDMNEGGNQMVTAYVYKADAPRRVVQSPNAIPAQSQAGKAALAAGGAAARKVEIPGVASSASPSRRIGHFYETQSSKGGRYTVTLADGTRIEELNKATAAQMQPFASVTVSGHFGNATQMAYEVARRAAKKGAKYYHITRQWQNKSGGNLTVNADLYK